MVTPYRDKVIEREPHVRTHYGKIRSLRRRVRCISEYIRRDFYALTPKGTESGGPE